MRFDQAQAGVKLRRGRRSCFGLDLDADLLKCAVSPLDDYGNATRELPSRSSRVVGQFRHG